MAALLLNGREVKASPLAGSARGLRHLNRSAPAAAYIGDRHLRHPAVFRGLTPVRDPGFDLRRIPDYASRRQPEAAREIAVALELVDGGVAERDQPAQFGAADRSRRSWGRAEEVWRRGLVSHEGCIDRGADLRFSDADLRAPRFPKFLVCSIFALRLCSPTRARRRMVQPEAWSPSRSRGMDPRGFQIFRLGGHRS